MPTKRRTNASHAGFTLVETLIALLILSTGLLALATAFAQGMVIMSSAHYHQIAKEKASEAIESVFTSRDTRIISWSQIRNQTEGGIFLRGPQPLRRSGADGLINTADDAAQPIESETRIGPNGQQVEAPLSGFHREIRIIDLSANLRQITVTVQYQLGPITRQYQLTAYISSFA
jgi:prepilin-type N-terminal cleavage/methylation domain-containing protein